jgi:SlyX protein
MSNEKWQEQMIELQTRLIFQEDTLQELNTVIARQDEELRRLQEQLRVLGKRFDDYLYSQEQKPGQSEDQKPPHY